MIVVLSYSGDAGTTYILKWLDHYNVPYERINLDEENVNNINFTLRDNKEELFFKLKNGKVLNWSDVSYSFYRGGGFKDTSVSLINIDCLSRYSYRENKSLEHFYYEYLSKKCLGNLAVSNSFQSKLTHLLVAKKMGLLIPNTYIYSSDFNIINNLDNKLITKSIDETIFEISSDNILYDLKTKRVFYNNINGSFSSSLFQNELDKDFEIRVVYLDGKFFSLGMKNIKEHSEVDVRNCFDELFYFRYSLSRSLTSKIKSFMNEISLNFGVLDIIKGKDKKYYFLEVNPTGQYDWVSYFGNYNIEKEIALYLKEKYEKRSKTAL